MKVYYFLAGLLSGSVFFRLQQGSEGSETIIFPISILTLVVVWIVVCESSKIMRLKMLRLVLTNSVKIP